MPIRQELSKNNAFETRLKPVKYAARGRVKRLVPAIRMHALQWRSFGKPGGKEIVFFVRIEYQMVTRALYCYICKNKN